jgi:branched-subunit amino acid aminotransferase/4-amino-4-deoxychorismate lyase
MIWSDGKILPDGGLSITVQDRTFEHGLGLFETLRTWGGRPTLLELHKARMLRSAAELDLSIEPASLPDESAVRRLLEAEGIGGDRLLRITASGGTTSSPSVVWMKSGPLPEPVGEGGASLLLDGWMVSPDEPLTRHKSLNYWERRRAFEAARSRNFDETLSISSRDLDDRLYFQEGSRTNLFLLRNRGIRINPFGAPRPVLVTSSRLASIVPGILRDIIIGIAGELSLEVDQREFGIDATWLGHSDEIFLTNSVRGIIPVGQATFNRNGQQFRWPAPGPWTVRLQEALAKRLWPEAQT